MKGFESIATKEVLSKEELFRSPRAPSQGRLEKGAVAVIECVQEIPCNPCESACPKGAIKIGEDILSVPVLDEDKCTGCGLCIPACPGLAIFVVTLTFSEDAALVQLPHEFLPLPKRGETVKCLNREGKIITKGKVVKVVNPKGYDRTPVISMALPKQFAHDVRAIAVKE